MAIESAFLTGLPDDFKPCTQGLRASEVLIIITTTTTTHNCQSGHEEESAIHVGLACSRSHMAVTLQEDLGGTYPLPGLDALTSTSGESPDFSLSLLNPNFPEAPKKLPLLKISSFHSFQRMISYYLNQE